MPIANITIITKAEPDSSTVHNVILKLSPVCGANAAFGVSSSSSDVSDTCGTGSGSIGESAANGTSSSRLSNCTIGCGTHVGTVLVGVVVVV